MLLLEVAELPAESSAGPVDVVLAPVELPLVDADTFVTAGPVENPGGAASLQARIRAARMDVRMAHEPSTGPVRCQLENARARNRRPRTWGAVDIVVGARDRPPALREQSQRAAGAPSATSPAISKQRVSCEPVAAPPSTRSIRSAASRWRSAADLLAGDLARRAPPPARLAVVLDAQG